jgi:hypothetical protein
MYTGLRFVDHDSSIFYEGVCGYKLYAETLRLIFSNIRLRWRIIIKKDIINYVVNVYGLYFVYIHHDLFSYLLFVFWICYVMQYTCKKV